MATWTLAGLAVDGDQAVAAIRASFESGRLQVWLRRQPTGSLTICTNGQRAMLVWWDRDGLDEGISAVDPDAGPGVQGGFTLAEEGDAHPEMQGQEDEYPDAVTVPVASAVEAVRYIVDTDSPDPRLAWRRWT